MKRTYSIRETDGTFTEREPTVGKWYVEILADSDYAELGINEGFRDGAIARYEGDGVFVDDDNYPRWDATVYDNFDEAAFLAEQP